MECLLKYSWTPLIWPPATVGQFSRHSLGRIPFTGHQYSTSLFSLSSSELRILLGKLWKSSKSGLQGIHSFLLLRSKIVARKKPLQIKRYKNWRWKQHVYLVTLHSVTTDVLPVDFLEIKLTAQTGDSKSPSLVITWNGTQHNEICLVETIIWKRVEDKIIPSFIGGLWRTSRQNIRGKSQRIVDC